jgi:hypothetical protein
MGELPALAMMWVGALVAAIGPVGAAFNLVRMVDAQFATAGEPTKRRIATLHYVSWMMSVRRDYGSRPLPAPVDDARAAARLAE